ncbi:MAG: PAAR-like protein [Fusobacteriaceae bacterium]
MKILVEGSICICNEGTAPCAITSKANSKVKILNMKAIVKTDVTMMPPTFGICQKLSRNAGGTTPVPCVPFLGSWNTQIDDNKAGREIIVTEKDKLSCSNGGQIKVLNNLNNKISNNK